MARFASLPPKASKGPWSIGPNPQPLATFEGGSGFAPSDPHLELFNAAVSGLLADQFYETGSDRLARLMALVPQCDPVWLRGFIPWLRDTAHLRSAPLVLAAEYARAKFPNARQVVASVLKRPDEPGEMLAFWFAVHGRSLPSNIKRGVADACSGLFNEWAAVRYDGGGKAWRLGDVIEVVHPKPTAGDWQSDLFKFLLDRRRHDVVANPSVLPVVAKTLAAEAIAPEFRTPEKLAELVADPDVVFSWERAAGWVNGGMNAKAWEAVIPTMGYMALLRNLNNFDRARIDATVVVDVIDRISNPQAVAKSKVLPFRFLTAYKALEADTYKVALSEAADHSLRNLPHLSGRTLIMVDCSGSMGDAVGAGKSRQPLRLSELAGLMAEALASSADDALIATYDTAILGMHTPKSHVNLLRRAAEGYQHRGGTATWSCTRQALAKTGRVDRIIIITDEQTSDRDGSGIDIPVITWNLAGYRPHHAPHGDRKRMFVGGYSDVVLQTLPAIIGLGTSGVWPWQVESEPDPQV